MSSIKSNVFLSIFLVFCSYLTISTNPQGILIFLDDTEETIGAISEGFLTAVSQHAGPIIVSGTIVNNLFKEHWDKSKIENLKTLDSKALLAKFRVARSNPGEYDSGLVIKYILRKASNFDATQWVIKAINEHLYLFLPHTLLKSKNLSISQINESSSSQISNTELTLGLKVNHMKTVSLEESSNSRYERSYADYFSGSLFVFATKKSDIFCVHSDYASQEKFAEPSWTIYMEGHGAMASKILGVQIRDFEGIVAFYQNYINANLLAYTSCYAAGRNEQVIYNDAKAGIQKTYSFPIITQAITDAPVARMSLMVDVDAKNNLKLETFADFAGFLHEAQSIEINYKKITEYILSQTPAEMLKIKGPQVWANVPQIKLPGVAWFSALASQKEIVSIGSVLAQARGKRQLDVTSFFKTDPKAILLYAPQIPFELVINTNTLESIISMVPGNAMHTIEKISSNKPVEIVVDWFMKIANLDSTKIFFIKRTNDANEVIIYNEMEPGWASRGIPDKYHNFAFYNQNGLVYAKETGKRTQQATKAQQEKYNQLIAKVKEMLELKDFSSIEKIIAKRVQETKGLQQESIEQTQLEKKQQTASKISRPENEPFVDEPKVAEFFKAIRSGNTGLVKQLLDQGMDPNVQSKAAYGKSALEVALLFSQDAPPTAEGVSEIVKLLVQAGADVNKQASGRGPLIYDAPVATLQYLLDHGSEVTQEGIEKWAGAKYGRQHILKKYLEEKQSK